MDVEYIEKINLKNDFLDKKLNLNRLKQENLEGFLKKVSHDVLFKYKDNFEEDGKINEKQYHLYLDDIVNFQKQILEKKDLQIEDLLELHRIITKPLKKENIENIGKLRKKGVITREKKYHIGLVENFISENKVKKYMTNIFYDYNSSENNLEKIIILYNFLIAKIHPFHNGNNRVISILLDTLLIKYNYFPIFLGGQNKYKRVVISEKYIVDRNFKRLISETYKIMYEIYSNYKIK